MYQLIRQQTKHAIQRDENTPSYGTAPFLSLRRNGSTVGFIFDDNPGALIMQTHLPATERKRIIDWARKETSNADLTLIDIGPPVKRTKATATDI